MLPAPRSAPLLDGGISLKPGQTLIGAGTPDERFVQALYLLLLGRTGEASGVAGWVAGLPSLGRQGAGHAGEEVVRQENRVGIGA